VKILFSMRHSGALRNFSSTIAELAARGHQVHLAFMVPEKGGDPRLIEQLTAHPNVTAEGTPPVKRPAPRPWLALARSVRNGRDYVRFRTPAFASATALRERAGTKVPGPFRTVMDLPLVRSPRGTGMVAAAIAAIERTIPPDADVLAYLQQQRPDVLLVSPLIDLTSDQGEYVKAARALGIPTAMCLHSWDNLTTKGLIGVQPDRVFVWNEPLKREAVDMHGCAPGQVEVTGAPVYDQWFDRQPSLTRDAFCATVGLPSGRPFLLYLCSSPFISRGEEVVVKQWLAALRAAADPRLRDIGVLVRPHPRNKLEVWSNLDLRAFGNVVVWPTSGSNPVDADTRNGYFNSLFHAAACIGINTSAQIEAAIVGRPVFTFRVPQYAATQEGTLHFHYLLAENGGPVRVAETLDAHVASLAQALDGGEGEARRLRAFVETFVRPCGLDRPATGQLANAIEALGTRARPRPARPGALTSLGRLALYPFAVARSAAVAGGAGAKRAPKGGRS
jgi:hypothetical protein